MYVEREAKGCVRDGEKGGGRSALVEEAWGWVGRARRILDGRRGWGGTC